MLRSAAFIARQPICDAELKLQGYELLYRPGPGDRSMVGEAGVGGRTVGATEASRETLVTALADVGLDRLVGEYPAFVNLGEEAILERCWDVLSPERFVLEVLEDVPASKPVLAELRRLKEQGFRIALDDFAGVEERAALLTVADIVKLDVRALSWERLVSLRDLLVGAGRQLLAEKVETADELARCAELGFELFQGHYVCRPIVVEARRLHPRKASALNLLARLYAPAATMDDIEEVVRGDVALSHRFLRYINSSFFSLPLTVDSVRRALLLLGPPRVRSWASLLILSTSGDNKADVLTTTAVRARMCQLLAEARGDEDTEPAFTVGLFSALDALMGQPMEVVLADLPLSAQVGKALLHRQGPLGDVLACCLAYEEGAWSAAKLAGVPDVAVVRSYMDALDWAKRMARLG